jgi:predicted GH43/DUF377 family glycosyl hydrolase
MSVKIVGVAQKEKSFYLYFSYTNGKTNFFKYISSDDGFKFDGQTKYITVVDDKRREEKSYDWKDMRISLQNDTFYITYKVDSKTSPQLNVAESKDLIRWTKLGKIPEIKELGAIVPDFRYKNRYVMYYGDKNINIAYSSDMKRWKPEPNTLLEPRKDAFDSGNLEIGGVIQAHEHILLIYYVKKEVHGKNRYEVGACIFDRKNPESILWRSEHSLWDHPTELHHEKLRPLGVGTKDDQLILYWLVGDKEVFAISCPIPGKHTGLKDKLFSARLHRSENNPIIAPRPHIPWESRATFNSAAVYEDGKVHFLYRSLGDNDLNVLGYATSSDGITIDERLDEPCYIPREPWETPGGHRFKSYADHFSSGGGYGGIEDPRITRVGDEMVLTYVAYDGANPPRAAMSKIDVKDFVKQRWNNWSSPKLISSPGMVNKSAVVLPEKVNGKYVVLHRVYPNILVDYLDDLNFDKYLQGHHFIPPRKKFWDSKKVGAGAPPMLTKDGWLLIYQSVGFQDPGRYKIGAMMLDRNNPSKVLYRSNHPLIAPDMDYENAGHKSGVVYPCGAVTMNGKLHVYYGGADTVVCAASADLDTFLEDLKYNREPKMQRVKSPILFN